MELLKKVLLSKNIWTISFAMFVVWLGFSGLGAMLSPQKSDAVFLYYLEFVLISFLGATAVVKSIQRVLEIKFSFSFGDLPFDPLWIFVLSLGSLLFTCTAFAGTKILGFELFAGVLASAAIPAGLLRLLFVSINSLKNKLSSSNGELSILSDRG